MSSEYDVVIIGVGISGINAAYRVKTQLPGATYTILESRGGIGGTWDFFKYPGIRSDSDLHTFGFKWRPWSEEKAIASGESIQRYIHNTAADEGIDKHIQFHHKLTSANWSSEQQRWTLVASHDGKTKQYVTKFMVMASGYYDYENPLPTTIPGLANFKGKIVHPQFWPEDLDYTGKRMVVIGSGATAVTLIPVLAQKATHVTMLQRSPGYIMARPAVDPVGAFLKRILPISWAHKLIRLQFLVLPWLFFNFCRKFPNVARKIIRKRTIEQLPKDVSHDPHFNPSYNPWEQRMCLCPDGDFYEALRAGKCAVVTGHIKSVTETGVALESGKNLDADILVTATGLKIQIAGGAQLTIDKAPIAVSEKYLWKGVMLQDVPNMAVVLGYTNASWTLGADATAQLVTRLIKHMQSNRISSCMPKVGEDEELVDAPVLNLNSTYVTKAVGTLPKAANSGPWKARANYFTDYWNAKFGDISTGLQYSRIRT